MQQPCIYMMSNKSHTFYVGITTDIRRRVVQHKMKTYPNGFTARYHFDRLVWYEAAATRIAAAKREREIKGWTRARKVALIQQGNPNWLDLSVTFDDWLRF